MDQALIGLLSPKEPVQMKEINYKSNNLKDTQTKEVGTKESFRDTVEKAQAKTDKPVKEIEDTQPTKAEKSLSNVYEKVKRAQSVLSEEAMVIENEPLTVEGIETLLMQLLTTQFPISEETIEQVLNDQGITLNDLTNQETFRNFVMEALGQDEMSLLEGKGDIKAIANLWEQIKAIQSISYIENKVVTEEFFINQDEVIQRKVTTVEIPKVEEGLEQLSQVLSVEEIETIEVNPKNLKDVLQNVVDVEGSIGGQIEGEITDLGITLPIQGVLKEDALRYWQTGHMESSIMHTQNVENLVHAQMLEKIHYADLQSGKELEMQLTPKELGKLTLKMVEQNGVLTAQIKVDQDKTKELIMENLAALKEGLEKQGLVIKDVQVEVRKDSHQTQMEMGKQKSTKRIQDIIAKHMSELEEEQELIHTRKSLTSLELDYEA